MNGENKPLISIITIVYNNVANIERTILSVINQTYKNIEYIVIDGGSTDGTVDIIKRYSGHFLYWVSEPDKGIYNAMNKGIEKATGKYVLFLNSGDNFCEDESLDKIVLRCDNYDIVYNDLNIIDKEHSYIKKYPILLSFRYFTYEAIPHPGTLIKRNLFDIYGKYDESLKIVSDWKWFIIAICRNNVCYKNSGIIAVNFYLDGISSEKKSQKTVIEERKDVLEKEFPLYIEDCRRLNRLEDILLRLNFINRIKNYLFRIKESSH